MIERLCALQDEVTKLLGPDHAADCFCGAGGFWPIRHADDYRNEGLAVAFIERVTRAAIKAAAKASDVACSDTQAAVPPPKTCSCGLAEAEAALRARDDVLMRLCNKVAILPDPGACPDCGGWIRAGMTHDCEAEREHVAAEAQRIVDMLPGTVAQAAIWDMEAAQARLGEAEAALRTILNHGEGTAVEHARGYFAARAAGESARPEGCDCGDPRFCSRTCAREIAAAGESAPLGGVRDDDCCGGSGCPYCEPAGAPLGEVNEPPGFGGTQTRSSEAGLGPIRKDGLAGGSLTVSGENTPPGDHSWDCRCLACVQSRDREQRRNAGGA